MLDKKTLKKFGKTMGIAFAVIFCIIFFKARQANYWFLSISALFFVLAVVLPAALKPVYIAWMRFAALLGWVNSRLILLVIFYLAMAPMGLVMRLFGKDPLERKIDKNKESYWKQNGQKSFSAQDYERQF